MVWNYLPYGYSVSVALLFLASLGLCKRTDHWSVRSCALGWGAAFIGELAQIAADRIRPVAYDHATGIVPDAARDMVVQLALVASVLGLLVGAAALVAYAFQRNAT